MSPLATSGNAVFIDEFTPSGALVQSIAMPTDGTVKLISSGVTASEGMLTLSPDGKQLALTGYNATFGAVSNLSSSNANTVQRTVAIVGADTTSTLYSFVGLTSSGSDPRSAVVDGNNLYISGGANGIRYVDLSAVTNPTGNGSSQISPTATDVRALTIVDGQLYASSSQSGRYRVGKVGSGIPTAGNPTTTTLISTGASPHQVFLADLSTNFGIDPLSSTKGIDTLYLADEGSDALKKYTYNGSSWISSGIVGIDADDYRGLTGAVSDGVVTLYAVRKGGTTAAGGGELVKLVDSSGYNGAFAGAPTLIASASTGGANNTAFRGVAFVPSSGIVAAPEVNVQGGGHDIVDGDATPDAVDGTEFGSLVVGESLTHTFTIQNTGSADLTLTNPTSSDPSFAIVHFPIGPIAAGNSATFDVKFTASSVATFDATISFDNNDSDEGTYDFAVSGSGEANQPPVFVATGPFNVPENSPAGTMVGTVTASDPNARQSLTFSALGTGTGASLFSISAQGQITVNAGASLNYEAINSYTFGVRVTDDGAFPELATTTVTINITDMNEAPSFSDDAILRFILSGSPQGATVIGGPVIATDPDAGDAVVSYAIVGGNGSGDGAFTISNSGVISVQDADQVTSARVFHLQVIAIDSFGLASGARLVTVTVVPNSPPILNPSLSGFHVIENTPNDSLVGDPITATDDDEWLMDTIRFSIVAGNGSGAGAFKIDPLTGQIRVNDSAQLDYETTPVFMLTIRATDKAGAFDAAVFNIYLVNAPEAPFVPAGQVFSIQENSAGGADVGNVEATFDTATLPANRRFGIAGGNGAAPRAFAIDNTGMLTVHDASQLDYEAIVNQQFSLTVVAFDATTPRLTTSQTVIVRLINVHEGTLLAPGDLLLTGANGDDHDEFTFAPLVNLAPYTEIRFTDAGWLSSGGFRAGEGVIVYVAPAGGLAAGTEIGVTKNGMTGVVSLSHGSGAVFDETGATAFELGTNGDSLIAFQGTTESPTPLFAVATHRAAFDENAADGSTTALPTGLTLGVTAVAVGGAATDFNNAEYTGPTAGTAASLRAAVSNSANWTKSDLRIAFTYADFTFGSPPTDIRLDNNTVAENAAVGATVGVLSTIDPDIGDLFAYLLVTGDGADDNASFTLDGAVLKTAVSFNFEAKQSYTIRVRTTDNGGLFVEKSFAIQVTNVNEAPTLISLSSNSIAENQPAGTEVGTLSTADVDAGDSFTYELVSGSDSLDNAAFTIDGDVLKSAQSFNFEAKNSYSVRVRSTDSGGLATERVLTIAVADVNDAPTAFDLSNKSIVEKEPIGSVVGLLSTADPDAGDHFIYTLVSGAGSNDNASFSIDGGVLKSAQVFDFVAKNSYTVRIRSTDSGGLSTEQPFTIAISDVRIGGFETAAAAVYKENAAPLLMASIGTVADVQLLNFDGGKLTAWLSENGTAEDRLTVRSIGVANGQISVVADQIFITKKVNNVLTQALIGNFAGGVGTSPLVIRFNANAFRAEVQAALRAIAFSVESENPSTAPRTVSFVIADGDGGVSNTAARTVQVTAVNDKPVITVTGTLVEYTENGDPMLIDRGVEILDVDSPDFADGKLIVRFTSGAQSTDRFEILNEGLISVDADAKTVSYADTIFGTYVGTSSLTVTLNEYASAESVQELARHITYRSLSDAPVTTLRNVSFSLSDGDGATSLAATRDAVRVTPTNDSPTLTVTNTTPATFNENTAPLLIANSGVVLDLDATDFDGGILTVWIGANALPEDRLAIKNVGTLANQISIDADSKKIFFTNSLLETYEIAAYSGGGADPLVITFNNSALKAQVQATLRAITYENVSNNPSSLPRQVSFTLTDGDDGRSETAVRTVLVKPINDKPELTLSGTTTLYVENANSVVIDDGVWVSDTDSSDFEGGKLTVKIVSGLQSTDRLEIAAFGLIQVNELLKEVSYEGVGVIGIYSGGASSLTITLNNLATAAIVQELARHIAYRNLSDAPTTEERGISFTLSDGDGGTSAATGDFVKVIPVNDNPSLAIPNTAPATFNENAAPLLIAGSGAAADLDATNFDGGVLRVWISANALSEDRLAIKDVGTLANQIHVDAGLKRIYFTNGSLEIYEIATYAGGVGDDPLVITFNSRALKAEVQATVRALTYENVSDDPSPLQRRISLILTDGDDGESDAAYRDIKVAPKNDAATIENLGDSADWTVGPASALIAGSAEVRDVDSRDFSGGKLTVALQALNRQAADRIVIQEDDDIKLSGAKILYRENEMGTFVSNTTLTVTFNSSSATLEAVQALLRRVSFRSGSSSTLTRTVNFTLTDGDGGTAAPALTKSIYAHLPSG